ncbi:DUF3472 domain-containing protein [Pseudomonas glycinae]|uniref:DUF3472 domain-containing protein n=1 Tax=Pseudomonas glycinae TaxID=1785145 RepID=UPI001C89482A|nr:DUF3472 domain-containing protein [Pseudomonas glycinae]MBX8622079.1 DUF3472 domain-containing protein [Pseudomonas glycinae]
MMNVNMKGNETVTGQRNPDFPDDGPHVSAVFSAPMAELIYMQQEVAVGRDYPGIYWCGSNFKLGRWGGYFGLQTNGGAVIGGVPYHNNNICSIWGVGGVNPELEYGAKGLYSEIFTGEGVGLHTSHAMPWKAGYMYATVLRRWDRPGDSFTRVATFMYSYETGKWTHFSTIKIPEGNVSFVNPTTAGFLERFGGSATRYDGFWGPSYRMSADGVWEKPLYFEGAAGGNRPWTWDIVPDGDQALGRVQVVCGGTNSNTENYKKVNVQPHSDKPAPVDNKIAVMGMNARYQNDGVYVEWVTDDGRTPQFSHLLRVHTGSATGPVIASNTDFFPEKRSAAFAMGKPQEECYVSLVLTDIFNQQSNYGYTKLL